MALEDFEKALAEQKSLREGDPPDKTHSHARKHHHRHRHHDDEGDRHRHKRRRRSDDHHERRRTREGHGTPHEGKDTSVRSPKDEIPSTKPEDATGPGERLSRDAWMEGPTSMEYDFTQKGAKRDPEPSRSRTTKADFELKIHENELNKHHLQGLAGGKASDPLDRDEDDSISAIDYTFGDSGASWRMMKLKAVYRKANELDRPVDGIAQEQYGDLRLFDNAREEEIELDRRKTYGKGYVGKEKPSGELYAQRAPQRELETTEMAEPAPEQTFSSSGNAVVPETKSLDQSALNRLKAEMMKAKMKGDPNAATLEAEYSSAQASFAKSKPSDLIVLDAKDTRMLAGGRNGEVRHIDTKRGRERGLVEDNEDMSIEDMIREERRTKGQQGGDGRRFAERIAKDGKFDNDLEYLDENAAKLAKRVQKSDMNLKNIAISDFQKINKILDNCPLCHHEDSGKPPLAPVISLATRVYLTLPTDPEVSDGGACIVPVQHRDNLLYCDDDEWEEIRNFMKSLTRLYHDQGRDVIFYENAAAPHRRKHATMEAVPLPYSLGETAPAFFKEAFLTTDEEWTQHKKVIDTLPKSKDGQGKYAFRRSLAKEMPYFHVWFQLDGGLGHIVEDSNRWPKGDLFAREIIGGMLDVGPEIIKRQGKWVAGSERKTSSFQKEWRKFDWTRVLQDG